ncbi:hypothetical protein [Streptomyces sp. NPDC047868]|uniref:DUF7352 domain-containing protein n=1 Tax=Streptomyces sp. NPDC047868 TaxID=3155480 RepID=UPI00345333CC
MRTIPDVIHRSELAIDDRPHGIDLNSDILHAAVRRHGAVDVWYRARRDQERHMRRSFQIVGDGHPIPPWLGRHQRTALSPDGQLVWHILENNCQHSERFGRTPAQVPGVCPQCGVHIVPDMRAGWAPA